MFGLIIGLPALRLKGDYLAIVTLAFGEIIRTVLSSQPLEKAFGGPQGLSVKTYSDSLFVVSFVVLIFMLFIVQNFIRSKHGRGDYRDPRQRDCRARFGHQRDVL